MFYDFPNTSIGGYRNLDAFKKVMKTWEDYIPKHKIVMLFEPGSNAATGN